MNFLHEMQRWVGNTRAVAALSADQVTDESQKSLRVLAPLFWRWFRANRDDVVLERKLFGVGVTVRLKDLSFAFERIFGPQTAG